MVLALSSLFNQNSRPCLFKTGHSRLESNSFRKADTLDLLLILNVKKQTNKQKVFIVVCSDQI